MPENNYPKSAKKFRKAIDALGLSQVAFAAEVGMGDRHIRKFCSGECDVPKIVWMAIELLELKRRTK